ncbi:MAG: hypothetical protein ACTSXJ_07860 [Candidatus Baldrarchaeia archaeon]
MREPPERNAFFLVRPKRPSRRGKRRDGPRGTRGSSRLQASLPSQGQGRALGYQLVESADVFVKWLSFALNVERIAAGKAARDAEIDKA